MIVKDLKLRKRGWELTYRERNSKPRLYVDITDESIMENLMNRRSRPINVYRKLAYQALEQIGYTKEDVKLNWSQYAGCSCPCSPGFIATFSDRRMLAQTDLWVQI